jgi:hypothetical protein
MPKRSSKGRLDLNQLAKSIVDQATGEEVDEPEQSGKNPSAVALGRLGGKKGGKARAEKLTPEERKEIARGAANARWKKAAISRSEDEIASEPEMAKFVLPPVDTT